RQSRADSEARWIAASPGSGPVEAARPQKLRTDRSPARRVDLGKSLFVVDQYPDQSDPSVVAKPHRLHSLGKPLPFPRQNDPDRLPAAVAIVADEGHVGPAVEDRERPIRRG